MIISSFFSANLRKPLSWVTAAAIGNVAGSSFNITLQASRPCTFTLVSVSPTDINAVLSNGVIYVSNNPRNNVTYSITVRATAGLISTNRTFTFTAYNNPPSWVTPTSVTFAKTSPISYQLQTTDSDTSSISYTITSGALHPGISMSPSGLITGTNLYNDSSKTITVTASDGISSISQTMTFRMPPFQKTFNFPSTSTGDYSSFSSGRGPISIDDTWLNTMGWANVLTDLTVNYGSSRYFNKEGYTSTEGQGSSSPPTVSISIYNGYVSTLTVTFSSTICGAWGKRGENHVSDGSYYYPNNSNSGTSGGTGVAIYCPCKVILADVFGGGGGGGSGGAGADAWATSSGGRGGNGGNAIVIYSQGVTIANSYTIAGGGGGGGGGWGSSINGTSDGNSGSDASTSNGAGGNGGSGTGTGSTSGGAGGTAGYNGTKGTTHSSGSYADGGTRGMSIYSPYGYAYTLSPVGSIIGPRS